MASQPLERALAFLAGETEYVTIERSESGPGYLVRLGDHGMGQLPDGLGKAIPDAVLEAVRSVRKRSKDTVEMADAVIDSLWHEPRRKR
jgi:hypothetical protein